jgi:hypothetical protein
MRSFLLGLMLLTASGCTRANPDAVHTGGNDLSTPPLGGGRDLGGPPDFTVASGSADLAQPRDLAFGPGVPCGNMICESPDSACCVDNNSARCTTPNGCGNGGVVVACDGPEDCTMFASNVCCGGSSGGAPSTQCRFSCQGGEIPICHELADCPALAGYVACCPRAGTTLSRCSKAACQ